MHPLRVPGPAVNQLLLVAASGLAREVLALVRSTGSHTVVGILDDDERLRQTRVEGIPVVGALSDARDHPDAQLLVCIGSGHGREDAVARLAERGITRERFAIVVDPSVRIGAGSSIGPGSILLAGVVLTCSVTIGRHVVAMPHVTLTHDDVVEDYATLAAGVCLGGDVRVGAAAYLGMSSSVRQHVRIGPGATLGMAAALLSDLPAGQTWVGVPARPLRTARRDARVRPSPAVEAS